MSTLPRLQDTILLAPIGRGGEAVVYRGRHETLGSDVAVKVFAPIRGLAGDEMQRFQSELRAISALDHPLVVRILDYGRVPESAETKDIRAGAPFIVMDLANEGTLFERQSRLDWPSLQGWLFDVLDALAFAHAMSILHRDLKPSNVLLHDDGQRVRAQLADFGLSVHQGGPGHSGAPGPIGALGTPFYMAPEQLLHDWRGLGPWTDLFGLGCLVWKLVTGEPPFPGAERATALSQRWVGPGALEPRFPVPRGLRSWLDHLLAPKSSARARFAADAAAGLRDLDVVENPAVSALEPTATTPTPISRGPISRTGVFSVDLDDGQLERVALGRGLFALRRRRFVGRRGERAMLWGLLEEVRELGQRRVALLHGEAGLGKSRLAAWLCRRSHELGAAEIMLALHGATATVEDGLGAMVERHAGIRGLAVQEAARRLVDRNPQLHYSDAELLARALHADAPSAMDQRSRHALLRAYLRALGHGRPVLLWLDDPVRSVDTLRFLEGLLQDDETPAVLVVLTARSDELGAAEELGGALSALATGDTLSAGIVRVPVDPLDRETAAALAHSVTPLSSEVADQVGQHCGGHPLHIVLLLEDWVSRGLLSVEARPSQLALQPQATALESVWRRRLESSLAGVDPDDLAAFELAAALGEEVDQDEWREACELAELHPSAEFLDGLAREGLIAGAARRLGVADGTVARWSFAHGSLRELLRRRSQAAGRWASLNRACASAISSLAGGRAAERVGRHLAEAGHVLAASDALLRSAEWQSTRGDPVQVRRLLLERDLLLRRVTVRPHRALAGALLEVELLLAEGRLEEAATQAEELRSRSEGLGMVGEAARADRILGRLVWYRGDLVGAEELLDRARRAAEDCGAHVLAARARVDVGNARMAQGRIAEAVRSFDHALAAFEALHHGEGQGRALLGLGEALRQLGRLEAALATLQRSRAHLGRCGDLRLEARAQHNLGEIYRTAGRLEEAETHVREAATKFARYERTSLSFARLNLGLILVAQDRLDEAAPYLREAADLPGASGLAMLRIVARVALLQLAARDADWSDFDTLLAQAAREQETSGYVDRDLVTLAEVASRIANGASEPARAAAAERFAETQRHALSGGGAG